MGAATTRRRGWAHDPLTSGRAGSGVVDWLARATRGKKHRVKLVVIGGDAAGMSAASQARRRLKRDKYAFVLIAARKATEAVHAAD